MSTRFPKLELHGTAAAIGHQHGEALRDAIRCTLEFYRSLFGLTDSELQRRVAPFRSCIAREAPHYAEEIDAIAAAAGLDADFLYALNSRSELLNNLGVAECTTIYNSHLGLLAQNWDWSELLEELLVEMHIELANGHRLCTLTEPGMIGKIGMNSAGIGVCLNILQAPQTLRGLPVHVLLRGILDSVSFDAATAWIDAHPTGKASHVLVASACGRSSSIEFCGHTNYRLHPVDGSRCHTNHYLADEALNERELIAGTRERWARAAELLQQAGSYAAMVTALNDQAITGAPICRPYQQSATAGFGLVGTVLTIIMNLCEGQLAIRRGPVPDGQFYAAQI